METEPVRVRLECGAGATLLSRNATEEIAALPGLAGHRHLEWFVRAQEPEAKATIVATHPKAGTVEVTVPLPP